MNTTSRPGFIVLEFLSEECFPQVSPHQITVVIFYNLIVYSTDLLSITVERITVCFYTPFIRLCELTITHLHKTKIKTPDNPSYDSKDHLASGDQFPTCHHTC